MRDKAAKKSITVAYKQARAGPEESSRELEHAFDLLFEEVLERAKSFPQIEIQERELINLKK